MFKTIYYRVICMVAVLVSAGLAAFALPVSYYTGKSVLSSGNWVKVRVTDSGVQEISFRELREMGFADPQKVAVYGYSGVLLKDYDFSTASPDDLPRVASMIDGEKLLFYADADAKVYGATASGSSVGGLVPRLDRNLDNACSYFFLTDSFGPGSMEVVAAEPAADKDVVTAGYGLAFRNFKDRKAGVEGAYVFGPNLIDGPQVCDLAMPGYDPAAGNSPSVNAGGCTFSQYTSGVAITLDFGGATFRIPAQRFYADDMSHKNYYYVTNSGTINGLTKREGDVYPVKISYTSNSAVSQMSVDYFTVIYPRYSELVAGKTQYFTINSIEAGQAIELGSAASGMVVWEVGPDAAARRWMVKDIDGKGRMGVVSDRTLSLNNAAGNLRLLAFDPKATHNHVEFAGKVANQNWHGANVPQMLVIASDIHVDAARRLAELHARYTGVDVMVVPFSEICNEFASGLRHPMAVRRAAKMFYDRDPSRFKALLIFGRAAGDNTGITYRENTEEFEKTYVPMLQCQDTNIVGEITKSYSSDAFYGMLDDDFVFDSGRNSKFLRGVMQINVGRIPAVTAEDADGYLTKAEKYLADPSDRPTYGRAILLADRGDNSLHIKQAEQIAAIIEKNSPDAVISRLYTSTYNEDLGDDYLRSRLLQQLQRGVDYWIFMGHSWFKVEIGAGPAYSCAIDSKLRNPAPPFFVAATCETLVFDTYLPDLQSDMISNPTGGMVAGIGPTRPVLANPNLYSSLGFSCTFFGMKPGATFGDVFREARNMLATNPGTVGAGSTDAFYQNLMSYNFGGDPMMPMRIAQGAVKLTHFDGKEIADGDEFRVTALGSHKLSGCVVRSDGSVDEDFNGYVTISVYDGAHTLNNLESKPQPASVTINDDLLQEVRVEVKNGRFEDNLTFGLPAYISESANRVTFHALSADKKRRSYGTFNQLYIGDADYDNVDLTDKPEIIEMYVDSPEFSDGDVIGSDVTLYATVNPSKVGFSGLTDRFGQGMKITVDNSDSYQNIEAYVSYDDDGVAHIAYPMSELADGYHTVSLYVTDMAGNIASRDISLNVINVFSAETVTDEGICREKATIDLNHGFSDAVTGRVVITAHDGNTVFTADNVSFPYEWNLSDNQGNPVEDGLYSVRCYFKSGLRHGTSTPAPILVGR